MKTSREEIELYLKLGAFIVALFGVATYFYDQLEKRKDARKAHSFQLIEEYYGEKLGNDRQVLFSFWQNNLPSFNAIAGSSLSQRELRAIYKDLFSDEGAPPASLLLRFAEFFDRVGVCVKSKICAFGPIDDLLCASVESFSNTYGDYIKLEGSFVGLSDLGEGMEWLKVACSSA